LIRRLILFACLVFFVFPIAAQPEQPWFFAVLADPQFGMYAKDRNFAQETANFEFAVATLNRLHPRFVVICGDLVNRTGDEAEIAEYKRILKQLDPSIPVYPVAGNHDVGNTPTAETIGGYRTAFGPDYYTFTAGSIFGIVLNSNLMTSPATDPGAAQQQDEWLKKTLAEAKADAAHQTIVFQHIPYFLHNPGELDDYFNFPQSIRRKYLDLLENAGVRSVFAGHYHRNGGGADGPLREWIVGATGLPIRPALSGFRIVMVNGDKLDSRWYCLAGLPNELDPNKLPVTNCPQ
jgi:3',5'-cyclic AMP phosphodiesterase CpdA